MSIAYDAAGNRTLMTDGTGSRTYQYNQLSQLTSETRQFAGLTGNFTLSYEYNLPGALKAFTDHAGSRVDYAFNNAGMLTAVTGSGAHSIPTYLSNIAYRAWGAIKDTDFGNGAHQHLNFNSRLQNSSMSLSNGSISATWNFDYYADGKIQKVTDSQNPIFDRAFDYDHIGRLQEVRTGSEARGGSTPDGPFKQTYTYDVWENTIARSYRIWSGSMQSDSATFTNNKRQYWSYDNEGNLGADFDANYGYDAAGRQNHFIANVYVGGWPTPHPQQSVMEILQTFDGNSTPVKKTTITRSEYYVGEDVHIQENTSHVYYLRSSVLGKIIAVLDQTGDKRVGYVFAGGMQIATQEVWNPGSYGVALTTTSPATGSEYMVGGPYLGRKELDPFGADVTEPPAPMLISEPVFYNPKFADMLMEIEGGPSDEYEQNNADWASLVTATIQAAQERDRAEKLWQSGKRSEAMAILHRNPNVGIEYRALVDGEVVRSGSYFGKDAADFLNGLNMALDEGLLSPRTEQSGAALHHSAGPDFGVVLQSSRNPIVAVCQHWRSFARIHLWLVSEAEVGVAEDVFEATIGYSSTDVGQARDGTTQPLFGVFPPDARGHLAGKALGGSFTPENLTSQNQTLNNGAIKAFENAIRRTLTVHPDWTAHLRIQIIYPKPAKCTLKAAHGLVDRNVFRPFAFEYSVYYMTSLGTRVHGDRKTFVNPR